MIILNRLQRAGSESRICNSQFGFRRRSGTSQALALLRRMLDSASSHRACSTHIIFLDWSRAFDKIKSDALLRALERFGLPSHIVNIIHAIYSCRNFDVRYGGTSSDERRQYSGIAQVLIYFGDVCIISRRGS